MAESIVNAAGWQELKWTHGSFQAEFATFHFRKIGLSVNSQNFFLPWGPHSILVAPFVDSKNKKPAH